MWAKKTRPLFFHTSENPSARERPWVVITHHFGGNENTAHRHVAALTAMGFDCVTFPFSMYPSLNMMKRWRLEIDGALAQLEEKNPGRKKILYSFSGPAACALHSIARRLENGVKDVTAFICDSGPFVDIKECTRLMISQVYGIRLPVRREVALVLMMAMWGPGHDKRLRESLQTLSRLQPDFPILSFRGIHDTIVPIDKIRGAFKDSDLKNLTAAELDCGHLTGLRDRAEEYKKALEKFLL